MVIIADIAGSVLSGYLSAVSPRIREEFLLEWEPEVQLARRLSADLSENRREELIDFARRLVRHRKEV